MEAREFYDKRINEEPTIGSVQLMEEFAQIQALEFIEFIEVNGFRRLEQSEEYSNGEIHRTKSELHEMFLNQRHR